MKKCLARHPDGVSINNGGMTVGSGMVSLCAQDWGECSV